MDTVFKVICVHLLVSFFCGYTNVNSCKALSPKYGTVTPDHDLEVGSPLQLNCTLFHHNITLNGKEYYVNSSQLYFKFSETYITDLEIIDPLTAQLTLENSTVNNTGFYFCYLKLPSNEDIFMICSTEVRVGYKPQPIEKFNCTSIHYRDLRCEWKPAFNPVNTTYTLYNYVYFLSQQFNFGNSTCPVQLTSTSCQWGVDTRPIYRKQAETLYFQLKGRNSLGENNQFIQLDHYKIVLPDKPIITHSSNASTCHSIDFHWRKPKDFEFETSGPKLIYELWYRSKIDLLEHWKKRKIENSLTYKLVNLEPYTIYIIRIRCKTVKAEENMWSVFAETEIRTLPDVPYLVPEIINEAVEVENLHGKRNISLHWKPVPEAKWNGENFEYHVHYVSTYISRYKREEQEIIKVKGNSTFATIKNLDQNTAYSFYIRSSNKYGTSSNHSSIVVPKTSAMQNIIPQDISLLYYEPGKYKMSWQAPKSIDAIVRYTIFWCKSDEFSTLFTKCAEPIGWKVIIAKDGKREYEEELHFTKDKNMFALASSTRNSTSGMQSVSCIASHSEVLNKINKVELKPLNSTSIKVIWSLDCSALKKIIKYYTITYYNITNSKICTSYTDIPSDGVLTIKVENNTASSYVLTGLKKFTQYKVTLNSFTDMGPSENSDARCAKTLPSAPSDPPQNIKVLSIVNKTVTLLWNPPLHPNGIVSHYNILYNKYMKLVKEKAGQKFEVTLRDNIFYFTNYSIQIEACVDKDCSPLSEAVYAVTGIGVPERMDPPSVEVINATYVRLSWKPPQMANGPINNYSITIKSTTSGDYNDIITVPGSENYTFVALQCPNEEQGVSYSFRIQAVNLNGKDTLFGPISEPVQTKLCYMHIEGIEFQLIIGITVGGALGLGTLVFVLYLLVRWMKNKMDYIKNIKVQLPTGLDSEHPSHSYEHFKHGLVQKGSDSSVSPRTYGRLNSYASDDGDSKDRHDSGNSQYSNLSTEELLHKRSSEFGRNPSGDSNTFSRGHDSISSSATNRTQLSSDSGTEMDLQAPPSPDTVFPDSVSASTTPKTFTKSGLPVVEEGHDSDSKDSGLEKEGTTETSPTTTDLENDGHYTRFAGYLNNNSRPYMNTELQTAPVHHTPYSKFGVTSTYSCIPVSGQSGSLGLLDRSLANSEPSVVDFDGSSDSEPVLNQSISPYSRYGLARSVGAELDKPVFPATGYSKVGVGHHTFNLDSTNRPSLEPASAPYSKFGIQGSYPQEKKPYVTTNFAAVLLDKNKPNVQGPEYSSLGMALNPNNDLMDLKSPINFSAKEPQCPKDAQENFMAKSNIRHDGTCSDLGDLLANGYSKFGIQQEPHKPVTKNYIGFQQTKDLCNSAPLKTNNCEDQTSKTVPATGYSKIDLHSCIDSQPGSDAQKSLHSQNNLLQDSEVKSLPPLSRTSGTPPGTKMKTPVYNAHDGYVPHSQMEISKLHVPSSAPASSKSKNSYVSVEDVSNGILPSAQNEYFVPAHSEEVKSSTPVVKDGSGSAISAFPLLNTVPGSHLNTDNKCTSKTEEVQPTVNAPPIIKPPSFTTDDPEPKVTLCNGPKLHYRSKFKAQSNGYVPMSDILGSDVTHDSYKVEIVPNVLQNGLSLSESDI